MADAASMRASPPDAAAPPEPKQPMQASHLDAGTRSADGAGPQVTTEHAQHPTSGSKQTQFGLPTIALDSTQQQSTPGQDTERHSSDVQYQHHPEWGQPAAYSDVYANSISKA